MNKEKKVRFFSNIKAFKIIDFTLLLSLAITAVHITAYIAAQILTKQDHLYGVLVIGFCIFLYIRFCRFFKKNNEELAIKFEGNIDQMILKMVAKGGLHLKGKIGEYYTFCSYNKILPNVEYTIRDCGNCCIVISPDKQLSEILQLQSSCEPVKKDA
jgi:hypothetical protein